MFEGNIVAVAETFDTFHEVYMDITIPPLID